LTASVPGDGPHLNARIYLEVGSNSGSGLGTGGILTALSRGTEIDILESNAL